MWSVCNANVSRTGEEECSDVVTVAQGETAALKRFSSTARVNSRKRKQLNNQCFQFQNHDDLSEGYCPKWRRYRKL